METLSDFVDNPETFANWKNTGKVVEEALRIGKTVSYITPKLNLHIPIIDITEQTIQTQLLIANRLALAAKTDRRKLVYEYGNHPLSTGDAAVGLGDNITVIGFNPEAKELNNVIHGTENIKLPPKGSSSIALNTKLMTENIVDFPIAKQAQVFAPYPTDVRKLILAGCNNAEKIFVVINPTTILKFPPNDIVNNLPDTISAKVVQMTREEIEIKLGTSLSSFFGGYTSKDQIPVIVANLRIV